MQKTHNLAVDGQVKNGQISLEYKGSKIVFGECNVPLETDIQSAVRPRLREIEAAYEGYSSEGKPLVLETKGKNEFVHPIHLLVGCPYRTQVRQRSYGSGRRNIDGRVVIIYRLVYSISKLGGS